MPVKLSPTAVKRDAPTTLTRQDMRVGREGKEETEAICGCMKRKDVVDYLRDFLSDRPATAYGPKSKKGEKLVRPQDKYHYMMKEIEHALVLRPEIGSTLMAPSGKVPIKTSYGTTVEDGEIIEVTSGGESSVAPESIQNPHKAMGTILVHTHPLVPLDPDLKEGMLKLVAEGKDTMGMYNKEDHTLADPFLFSLADIRSSLALKLRGSCLGEVRKDAAGNDVKRIKCYNFNCLYPSEKRTYLRMANFLANYENTLREARYIPSKADTDEVLKRKKNERFLDWVEKLFNSLDYYNTNDLFNKFYYSPECSCEFRFDKR